MMMILSRIFQAPVLEETVYHQCELSTRKCCQIEHKFAKTVRPQGKQTILTEKLAMVGFWYLCNTTSMREFFGISQSTVFECVHDSCEALCSVRNRIIC